MAATADIVATALQNYAEGNLDVAEQHLWAALAEDSSDAEALRLLGIIAHQKGDLDQALDYLNRSLICNRSDAATWKNLGDAHFFSGNFREGALHYEQALRLQPNYAEVYNKLGMALDALGDSQRAACAFEAGWRIQPDSPEIAYNYGVFLHKEGHLGRAADRFRQALQLKPNYPEASNILGTIFKEQGLFDEAICQFQHTLKIRPDQALAHYHLSEFVAEGRYQFPAEDLQRLKDYLKCGNYSPLERSHFSFAVAHVLNRLGLHDEAFRHYKQANDLRRDLIYGKNGASNVKGLEALIDRAIASHGRSYFESVKGWGLESQVPIFIVGMPRSGSTLVEQILASHPQVFGAGEILEVGKFIANLAEGTEPEQLLSDQRATREVATAYLERIAHVSNGAARVTIKTLSNYLYLGEIVTLFPNARIIHCRRDALDLCLSCYFQNFKDMLFAWSLEDIGAWYRCYEKLMAHWTNVFPLPIHEVSYEELVANQEATTRDLVKFCGLDWDKRCLAFFNNRRVVRTASTIQVRKPISKEAIGRWQHFRSHLGPLFAALDWPRNKEIW